MLHYCQTRKFKRVGKKCKTIASKMKHLPRQEQRNNLQRRHHPSCETPPPPLPPSSPYFPTSSDTGAGLFFLPRPTTWWHIAVSCRSRGPPLRPHGTWWRSPRAAAGKGEEPSDETAACIWSGSREREGGEGRRCGSGIRWPVGFACSVFRSVFLAPLSLFWFFSATPLPRFFCAVSQYRPCWWYFALDPLTFLRNLSNSDTFSYRIPYFYNRKHRFCYIQQRHVPLTCKHWRMLES